MPETKLPAPGVGEPTALLPSRRLHLEALNLSPGTHLLHRRQGSGGRVRPQGHGHSRRRHSEREFSRKDYGDLRGELLGAENLSGR